jgi:hypothetical protein
LNYLRLRTEESRHPGLYGDFEAFGEDTRSEPADKGALNFECLEALNKEEQACIVFLVILKPFEKMPEASRQILRRRANFVIF